MNYVAVCGGNWKCLLSLCLSVCLCLHIHSYRVSDVFNKYIQTNVDEEGKEWEEVRGSTPIRNRHGMPRAAGVDQTICRSQFIHCCLCHDTANFRLISVRHKTDRLQSWQHTSTHLSRLFNSLPFYWKHDLTFPLHFAHRCRPSYKLHYRASRPPDSMSTDHFPATTALLPLSTSRV